MRTVVHNHNNLTYQDIDEVVLRARAVLINSNNEILLGYLDNTYQFPGGHVEKGERLSETLYREVLEETGINIERRDYTPFYQVKYYSKNHDNTGVNRYIEFNYYLIYTDKKYDLNKRKLDQYEIDNNYELRYVKLDELYDVLEQSKNDNERNVRVYDDIKNVIDYYFEKYNKS